jgi:hypothetical protein
MDLINGLLENYQLNNVRKKIMGLLREMKPKKAKFGFTAVIRTYNFIQVATLIHQILGKPELYQPSSNIQDERKWWFDLNHGAGTLSISLYINDESLYTLFRDKNSEFN